ncbi:MAG: GTP 3',8-cyclase MoaA [Lachnospiraceae bacterium]|nr:GTP 3',8-cyclase MoaA [Lachnospiraceae bacterium]MBQ6482773.1 GTP 3',8-cyclase MoaA [Anaerolineaceae bacterium]
MLDAYGREIDYLRISITDRCSLRCRYCMPDGIELLSMTDLLTYEEILEIALTAAQCGFRKIKVTGGEPLVRQGAVYLVSMLKKIPGIEQVTMTTNGILLPQYAADLKEAGLDAVNISLDTLSPERFAFITGRQELDRVLAGIEAALSAGIRTKLNVVLQKGVNDDEWEKLMLLVQDRPLDVRFIEMMPIGAGQNTEGISNEALLEQLVAKYPGAESDFAIHGNGPAVYLRIPGFTGSVGFISAIHGKFCRSCNRMRLTSTGLLKPCLCYDTSVDLRSILRSGRTREERAERLAWAFARACGEKPEEHCFDREEEITETRKMVQIGG